VFSVPFARADFSHIALVRHTCCALIGRSYQPLEKRAFYPGLGRGGKLLCRQYSITIPTPRQASSVWLARSATEAATELRKQPSALQTPQENALHELPDLVDIRGMPSIINRKAKECGL
jgi:hypothetical protein